MKRLIILMLLLVMVKACKNTEPDGLCNVPLSFSPVTLNFDVNGGDGVIESNSQYWSFALLFVDEIEFTIGRLLLVCDEKKEECELIILCENLYDPDNPGQQLPIEQVRCPEDHHSMWFSVKVDDKTKKNRRIFISVKPNESGKIRKSSFSIQAGNCFSEFGISQSAE